MLRNVGDVKYVEFNNAEVKGNQNWQYFPTSLWTLYIENLQLQEENDNLADIVLQKDHIIKKKIAEIKSEK